MQRRTAGYFSLIAFMLALALSSCGGSPDFNGQTAPLTSGLDTSATSPGGTSSGTSSSASNGSGSGGSATGGAYTVGGAASGLLGNGLAIQLNGGSNLQIQANGSFAFPASLAGGTQYSVTVASQPTSPAQTCVLANANGTTGNSAVANVQLTCTLAPSRFAYLGTHKGIYCYAIDAISGGLAPLATPECDTGLLTGVAVDPVAPFAYAASATLVSPGTNPMAAGAVRAYRIDQSTGQLVRLSAPDAPAGPEPLSVAVDPKGRFVFAGNYGIGASMGGSNGFGSVSAYTVDGATGALTPVVGSPFAAGYGVTWLVIHPSGKYVYSVNQNSGSISGFVIDQTSGALSAISGSPFPTPPSGYGSEIPSGMAVDPAGRFLFVSSVNTPDLFVFSIDPATGILSAVPGSPFPLGCGSPAPPPSVGLIGTCSPGNPTVDSSGAFLYVPGGSANAIFTLSIDPSTGTLAALSASSVAAGSFPDFVISNGAFLYASNNASAPSISMFSLNTANGRLTQINGSPVAAWPDPAAGAYNLAIAP